MTEYRYIAVGAGTAGCGLATRLSQEPGTRVLVLEAGGSGRTPAIRMPNAWPGNFGSPSEWAWLGRAWDIGAGIGRSGVTVCGTLVGGAGVGGEKPCRG